MFYRRSSYPMSPPYAKNNTIVTCCVYTCMCNGVTLKDTTINNARHKDTWLGGQSIQRFPHGFETFQGYTARALTNGRAQSRLGTLGVHRYSFVFIGFPWLFLRFYCLVRCSQEMFLRQYLDCSCSAGFHGGSPTGPLHRLHGSVLLVMFLCIQ